MTLLHTETLGEYDGEIGLHPRVILNLRIEILYIEILTYFSLQYFFLVLLRI